MIPALNRRAADTPPSIAGSPCHCCGFAAETERKSARIDGRMRPVCDVCDAALHLPEADWDRFTLAWIPELGQAQVGHLARTAFVARAIADSPEPRKAEGSAEAMGASELEAYLLRCGEGADMPREIFDACVRRGVTRVSQGLKARTRHLGEILGLDDNPGIVAFVAGAPPATRERLLAGLRLYPWRALDATLAAWREAGSPYAEIDGKLLHAKKGYVRD